MTDDLSTTHSITFGWSHYHHIFHHTWFNTIYYKISFFSVKSPDQLKNNTPSLHCQNCSSQGLQTREMKTRGTALPFFPEQAEGDNFLAHILVQLWVKERDAKAQVQQLPLVLHLYSPLTNTFFTRLALQV